MAFKYAVLFLIVPLFVYFGQGEAGKIQNRCLLPKDSGFQAAGVRPVQRWYYDVAEKQCSEFTFVPSGGNKNNFLTKDECERICNGF